MNFFLTDSTEPKRNMMKNTYQKKEKKKKRTSKFTEILMGLLRTTILNLCITTQFSQSIQEFQLPNQCYPKTIHQSKLTIYNKRKTNHTEKLFNLYKPHKLDKTLILELDLPSKF